MTVCARPVDNPPVAAIVAMTDPAAADRIRAGTYAYDGEQVSSGWHVHDLDQIEYAWQGTVEVETAATHHLLPPRHALWIPAGLAHRTTLHRVRTVSVFLDPQMMGLAPDRARILAAAAPIREMILHAVRWPIGRRGGDPLADTFFTALSGLLVEGLDNATPLCLPTSSDPIVAAAMRHAEGHPQVATIGAVCRAVGVSERTLRRRFVASTGLTWREYLLHSRMARAAALLSEPGPTVLDIAIAVGFDSASAFTRAFRQHTGDTPTAYRRRVMPAPGPG
ncbi:AraC family transcriptional regulator [Frankia sp. AvcI1]|uniref:helix-turn-helix transcriptional regulator n=2 Tax=Frankia sp. AvcI1 TaxID=573496 RepID=UPI0021189459|nr:AraC family transcriptional regulator [Frankia sp. AvcI1]